jgi:hypothetical protein
VSLLPDEAELAGLIVEGLELEGPSSSIVETTAIERVLQQASRLSEYLPAPASWLTLNLIMDLASSWASKVVMLSTEAFVQPSIETDFACERRAQQHRHHRTRSVPSLRAIGRPTNAPKAAKTSKYMLNIKSSRSPMTKEQTETVQTTQAK